MKELVGKRREEGRGRRMSIKRQQGEVQADEAKLKGLMLGKCGGNFNSISKERGGNRMLNKMGNR